MLTQQSVGTGYSEPEFLEWHTVPVHTNHKKYEINHQVFLGNCIKIASHRDRVLRLSLSYILGKLLPRQ